MDKVQGRLSDFFSDTRNRIIVAGTCVCVAVVIGVIVVAVVIQPTSASPTGWYHIGIAGQPLFVK